jgi:hypothetical protein
MFCETLSVVYSKDLPSPLSYFSKRSLTLLDIQFNSKPIQPTKVLLDNYATQRFYPLQPLAQNCSNMENMCIKYRLATRSAKHVLASRQLKFSGGHAIQNVWNIRN